MKQNKGKNNFTMEPRVNRTYKDGMFRKLFNEKEKMLELYNGLKGTNYGSEMLDKIEILTLDNVLYMGIRNDVAFSMNNTVLIMGEHQSTLCGNMPIRMAEYLGETFQAMFQDNLYGTEAKKIPAPEFYVFYNGDRETPAESIHRLSDHYIVQPPENSAEIVVRLINICYDEGKEIFVKCNTLREYSLLISFVKEFQIYGKTLDDAIGLAIQKAVSKGVLVEFLRKNGAEVTSMIHEEVTLERYGEIMMEEGVEKGIEKGRSEGETIKVLKQIQKNYCERLPVDLVAQVLDEPKEFVERVYSYLTTHPEASIEVLFGELC